MNTASFLPSSVRVSFFLVVFVFLSLMPTAAQTDSEDRKFMIALADQWVARYNAGDAAGVAALYTDEGYYVSAHVLAHGRKAIEEYLARGIKGGGHLDFVKPVEIYVEGNLGYFLGRYQATNAGVTVDGRILIVGKRVGGGWMIAAHQTVVRDQPE
jgi:ketosteroid isomerase-like protein